MKTITIISIALYFVTVVILAYKAAPLLFRTFGFTFTIIYVLITSMILGAMLTVMYLMQWYWILNIMTVTSVISTLYSIKYIIK